MPQDPETAAYWQNVRREQILLEGFYRRVHCPTCGAMIGEDCRSAAWHRNPKFHAARRKLADMSQEERDAWARDSYG